MRRRGNKSAKVPNVKLRPAQPGASLSSSSFVIQDSQIDNDDTKYYDPTPRPFAGVVLCATGITDKPTIFKQAVELGATTINDFTDRVTHLIALQHGGAKYMCALDRKIPILKPSWITDSHHIWLHGDDVDLEQSITQHRLPIFTDVVLCVSGIPDIVRRTQINKLVTKSGGSYVKALERPVRVTHLLCSGDDPTDKMYYAEKFNKQGEASIKLVWEEWFWDCLEFGGRFEEDRYQVQHPRPKPRKSVQEVNPNETSTIPANDPPPDDDEPVQASISKPVGFQRELWRSVLAPRGYDWNDDGTSLVKSPTKRPATRQVQEDEEENLFQGRRSGSVLSSSSFRRANSFAQLPLKQKQPLRRLLSTRVIADDALGMEIDTPGAGPSTAREVIAEEVVAPQPPPAPSIFSGLRFAALGEADSNTVREAIQKAGGTFIETEDGNVPQVDIIIVRLVSGSKMFRSLTSSTETTSKFRTECWLEKCLYEERPCPPESHVTFTPVGVPCPISGAENVRISFSGLDNAEKFFMTRLVKVLGLNLLPSFSKRATHLLCPSTEGLKFEKAQEWGVPVVGMAWMEEMKRTGSVPDVQEYLVAPMAAEEPEVVAPMVTAEKPEVDDPKGKRKATEKDIPIADITNYVESQTQDDSQSFNLGQPLPEPRPSISAVPSLSKLTLAESGSFGKPTALLLPPRPLLNDRSSITDPAKETSIPTSITSIDAPPRAQTPEPESMIVEPLPGQDQGADADLEIVPSSNTPSPIRPIAPKGGKGKARALTRTLSESMIVEPHPDQDHAIVPDSEIVPSSNTPSPIRPIAPKGGKGKARAFTRTKSSSSISPSKYYPPAQPLDAEATKALQESLSLLGKRRSDDSSDGAREGVRRRGDRSDGKRARPVRSKAPIVPDQIQQPAHAFDDDDSFGFGRANDFQLEESYQEESSMRVTYEDPEQQNEKRKLMSLFQSPSQDEVEFVGVQRASKKGTSGARDTTRRRTTRKSTGARG